MKNKVTELVCILDESGSMSGLEKDTIGGYNAMLKKQRELDGTVLVNTVFFANESKVIHDRVNIKNVKDLTGRDYQPGGCTALIDAIGGAIHHIGNIHKYARPEDVPEHTVFVITTDGYENASHRYTADQVRSMIRRQEEKYGWEFLFLAANIDAAETARHIGIRPENSTGYQATADGTRNLYACVDNAVASIRCCTARRSLTEEMEEAKKGK